MEKSDKNEPWWKPGVEIFGQVSTWVVVPIVAALIFGKWLDGRYGTKPWIFLGLSGIGFLISTSGIVYITAKYMSKISKEAKTLKENGKSNQPK